MAETSEGTRDGAKAWANGARTARHRCRQYLREESTTLAEVLYVGRHDELIGRLTLLWVLESLPEAGKVATRRRLMSLGIDGSTPLAELDEATSAVLLEQFTAGSSHPYPDTSSDADGSEESE